MRIVPAAFAAILCTTLAACGEAELSQPSNYGTDNDFTWRDHIVFTQVPETGFSGNTYGSAYYRDIMGHAQRKITNYSVPTNAHETNHMLNAETRNASPAFDDNVVYFEAGQAALITEPRLQAARIRDYVPQLLKSRSSKYQLYLVQQVAHWPNVLYQFDEWSAYRTDARVAEELDRAGTLQQATRGEVCIADGAIEFLYFASAAVRALHEHEPAYLRDNLQFKAAYAMLAEESARYFAHGRGRQVFDCNGSEFLEHFVSSQDNAATRRVLSEWLGAGWTQRVLGF